MKFSRTVYYVTANLQQFSLKDNQPYLSLVQQIELFSTTKLTEEKLLKDLEKEVKKPNLTITDFKVTEQVREMDMETFIKYSSVGSRYASQSKNKGDK